MTSNDPTTAAPATGRSRRPRVLREVPETGGPSPEATPDEVAGTPDGPAGTTSAVEAQAQRVESLLAAVHETVGSLAEASRGLQREVEQALRAARPAVPLRVARHDRPSAAHPAQAAVEQAALLEAVENRAVIEQAKGMLMLKHRCDADSAFGLLVEISRRERRKVREVAGDIVHAGTRPRRVVDVTDAAMRSGRVTGEVRAR